MNAVKLYIGIVYENDKRIAFSYQTQTLAGELISSANIVVKKQGLENFVATLIKRILMGSDKKETIHIGIYANYPDVIAYINKLIENKNYDHIRQLRYQPRGSLFKLIRTYRVKFLLSTSPKSEVFEMLQQDAANLLKEFGQGR
jgi:hypothetical protein